ncbi:MAG: HNH endonuclease [Bacteroidaceae bacterium]|nr:HNH endonuclease [Bacteroidaceae bacterium]
MHIPQSDILTTNRLGKIFASTAATYKFFWFVSIMQIHAKSDNPRISVWDIVIRMVANAWYPIHYFRLSFGKNDSLFDIVMNLQHITQIPIDANVETIISGLIKRIEDRRIRGHLNTLTQNVPFRFLSPWVKYTWDEDVIKRSQMLENGCLYSLHKNGADFYIILNPAWDTYLHTHYIILMDFAYWNLTLFLQTRNPNVPAIPNKLIRPDVRTSLTKQHNYWNMVMTIGGPIHCIYTNTELHPDDYALDHFIPWSFVCHDLLWNLIPSNGSINSSKSNKLPDLNYYLPKLATMQHHSIKVMIGANKEPKVMEDFVSLGYSAKDLADMNSDLFREIYERTFNPINQIALNMVFETWKY